MPVTSDRRAAATTAAAEDAKGHFANYAEYNKTLRTWFVSFGIAGLALLLTNSALFDGLTKQDRRCIIYGFLVGAGALVIVGFINKSAAWYMYAGCLAPNLKTTRKYRCWEWVTAQYWIDLVADLVSIASLGGVAYLFAMAKI